MSLKSLITTNLVSPVTKSLIDEPSLACYSFELVRIVCAMPLDTGSAQPIVSFLSLHNASKKNTRKVPPPTQTVEKTIEM
jgi:hypothetical protein